VLVLQVTQAAAAMPLRVRRIDNTLEQLETGNLKLRCGVTYVFLCSLHQLPAYRISVQQQAVCSVVLWAAARYDCVPPELGSVAVQLLELPVRHPRN
jgi:hypothetical protein